MELILISESKLKIMMTANDMEEYEITDETLGYEMKDIRKVFSGILDEAKKKTGFDSSTSKLFIQIYPSKNGGCEVYVTRNSDGGEQGKTQEGKGAVPQKKKTEYCAYSFGGIDGVMCACRTLFESGYENESGLYLREKKDGKSEFYLLLCEEITRNSRYGKKRQVSKSDLASEFGRRLGGRESVAYIREHTQKIIGGNAVEKLGKI